MSEVKAVFHACFKASPGSLQFVCQDEIQAGTSWPVDILHSAAESALFFFFPLSYVTQT